MSSEIDFIIVGLGNPGKKYQNNRHNIGFMVLDRFAKFFKLNWAVSNNFEFSKLNYSGKSMILCKPLTYMNLSGQPVKYLCTKYNIHPKNVIIIVDEYNFPVGKIHFKMNGSDGGHNGVTSIIEELEATEFGRVRCGIGRNFGQGELVNYVLSDFPEDESTELGKMIEISVESIKKIIELGTTKAMQEINTAKNNIDNPQ